MSKCQIFNLMTMILKNNNKIQRKDTNMCLFCCIFTFRIKTNFSQMIII